MMNFDVPPPSLSEAEKEAVRKAIAESGGDGQKSSKEMTGELIEEAREEYGIPKKEATPLDVMKEGRPEEVAARRAAYYEGKPLGADEKAEAKGVGSERLDTAAYQQAYREYLIDPKKFDKKPEPKDYPLRESAA